MIIKGKSRSNGKQLATYLLRADPHYNSNSAALEKVTVLEVQSAAPNLIEAFRDWEVVAEGTRGDKALYHAQISPAPQYAGAMTGDQWKRSADILAKELGLDAQPRAIVIHDGNGRPHAHVVWQRTDVDSMKMVEDGWNYRAHERASAVLEREFGHEIVPGKHDKRDREKQPEFPRAEIIHAVWQQSDRTATDPAARKAQITALKSQSDSPEAFRAALEDAGYLLAQGDRRDFVLVDDRQEVHSLGRQLKGMKAAGVRDYMQPIHREGLPTVEEAKALQVQKIKIEADKHQLDTPEPVAEPGHPQPLTSKFVPSLAAIPAAPAEARKEESKPPQKHQALSDPQEQALRQALAERQDKERGSLIARQAAEAARLAETLDREIREKLSALDALHQAAQDRLVRQQAEQRSGLKGLMERMSTAKKARAEEQRRQEMKNLRGRQADARRERLQELQQARGADMDDLAGRHDQQRRAQEALFKQEEERYIRDRLQALRLQAEIEAERRKQQSKFLGRGDDPPPKLVK